MIPTEIMVDMLSAVLPKEKIYPEVVPSAVQLPFIHYSESCEPTPSKDGDAGAVTTTVVSVAASTKAEAARLADAVVSALDMRESGEHVFYYQGREYVFFDQDRISTYDMTFKIL